MLNELIAFIASALGVCGALPQLFRLLHTKETKAISYTAYTMLAVSSLLWVSYGVVASVYSIIFWNSLSFVFALAILFVKTRNESPHLVDSAKQTLFAMLSRLVQQAHKAPPLRKAR